MGIFNDIVTGIGKELIGETDNEGLRKGAKSLGKMNSITKMAKDAVFTYPVVISEAVYVSDDELVFAIARFLETQYAVFTMIAMGLNPIMRENENVKDHILTFYSEESDELVGDPAAISNAIIDLIGHENFKIRPGLLEEYSTEASIKGFGDNNAKTLQKENRKQADELKSLKEDGPGMSGRINTTPSVKTGKLNAKLKNSDPTIIEVEFKSKGGTGSDIKVPLAIKAVPHVVTSEESARVFEYLREDKPLVQLVKLTSGEVKLFRDLLLQMDRAKSDKELYAKLGRHPWFRQLMKRSAYRKLKGIVGAIPYLSKFVQNKSDVLPICSLVVTKDEIETGMSNIWARIKKSNESVMDKLMLLTLCVVDTNTGIVEFDFYGLKHNSIYKDSTLKTDYKDGGANNDDMSKLIETLVYKV